MSYSYLNLSTRSDTLNCDSDKVDRADLFLAHIRLTSVPVVNPFSDLLMTQAVFGLIGAEWVIPHTQHSCTQALPCMRDQIKFDVNSTYDLLDVMPRDLRKKGKVL